MATGLRPASSNFVRILPMTPACRASGLRMLRVRSTAMSAPVRGGAFSRLEPQGQGAEQQLDVVVGEVEAPADEEVLSAHDASRRLVVQLPPIGDVVGAHRDEQMIEEPVVGVDLDPGMLLERVGELEDVPREDQRVVQQVQFHPEAAGVLQDAEAAADGTVPLGEIRAELELPLGDDLRVPAGEERVDRKSTRLNSSHSSISYAVFCLKKK